MVDQITMLVVGGESRRAQWVMHHIASRWPQIAVAAAATCGVAGTAADIVLLNVDFGGGADAGAQIDQMLQVLRARPAAYFVVLAQGGNELSAVRAFKSGARDYLPLETITRDLLLSCAAEAIAAQIRSAPEPKPEARGELEAPSAPDLEIPGYQLLKAIAESNFSAVYLARSERLRRNVVIKVLKRGESAKELADAERFVREYEIISSISHPAIVGVQDFGTLARHLFLAIEYFPCGDLSDRLRNPLTVEESRYYLRTLAEALRVIHVFGIYHRDLKPANVMLREDNSPVLIDFGLARRVEEVRDTTGVGKALGSPYYISPEQAQAQPVDARTDLYSLGVMFYEMLTGTRPYSGRNAVELLTQHVNSPVPALPPELSHQQPLLNKLMAKDLRDRYPSADALLADLNAELAQVA